VFILSSLNPEVTALLIQPPIAVLPISRDARKLRTRQQLMQAALNLVGQGRGFTSLSLREVTREIGVVPASFYRHFKDMDDLGLALVEQGGVTLRRLLREARRSGFEPKDMLRNSVLIYKRYLEHNRLVFAFIVGERSGGSPVIRKAIRREEEHFVHEMAQDLRELGTVPASLSSQTLELICSLVVSTMLNAANDILDLPADQKQGEQELVEHFVLQLRLIFLGARLWREPH
jgi:TetR/AcrR family transcriptional regulator, fatty acid biosynthesis regulator